MKRSKRAMRLKILSYLFTHLKAFYDIDWPRKVFGKGEISEHEVKALVAFKSDSHLDELEAALLRLESQKFGLCIRCAQDINQDLLDDDPTRRFCSACEMEVNRPTSTETDSAQSLGMAIWGRQFKSLQEPA